MNILIVGAGAVGQVYGYFFQQGGADVSFYVREKYVEESRKGFLLYPLNRKNIQQEPVHFNKYSVLSRLEDVKSRRWAAVVLCMSSTGLRGTEWFGEFSSVIGDATVVTLQPGLSDRDYVLRYVPQNRLVSGMISLISYHAPLPTEEVTKPGMAFWFPPFSPCTFSNTQPNSRRAEPLAKILKKGGMPTAVHKDVVREVAFISAALFVLLTALESEQWSFRTLKSSERFSLMIEASRGSFQIVSKSLDIPVPYFIQKFIPLISKFLLTLAPKFVPLDLETYFRVHFTKVKDQTRLAIQELIEQGVKEGLPVEKLKAIQGWV